MPEHIDAPSTRADGLDLERLEQLAEPAVDAALCPFTCFITESSIPAE